MAGVKYEFSMFDNLFMAFPINRLSQKKQFTIGTSISYKPYPIYRISKMKLIFIFIVEFS